MKNKTMGDKGEEKTIFAVCLEDERRKTIGAKNRKIERTESRMLISQHTK